MAKTIWKESLPIANTVGINLPFGAEILCVREQNDMPTIWFSCDPTADKVHRAFAIVATGGKIPEGNTKYLGTTFMLNGALVRHIFELL